MTLDRILTGHVLTTLATLPDECVQTVVTSPPYWGLRDYGIEPQVWDDGWTGSLGLEPTPELYVSHMVEVFRAVRRVLRDDGTLWLNLGDSYASGGKGGGGAYMDERGEKAWGPRAGLNGWRSAPPGLKHKDLCMIPARVALALQADGWYLRSDIVWHKPNPMPESVTDRPTKAHEYVFLLSKAARYYYDAEAVKEPCEIGPSDVRKMLESLPRIGGKHKELIDPLSKASAATNIGRKRSVGGTPKQDQTAATKPNGGNTQAGFNDREANGLAPLMRNLRSVWTVATAPFPGAHFATFPAELARRCILAGTSERGCCPECGKPWRRVVKRQRVSVRPNFDGHRGELPKSQERNDNGGDGVDRAGNIATTTTGWAPTCSHDLPPAPCVVLDPFSGAGTTLLEALRNGRHYLGCELKPEYVAMAERRIRDAMGLFAGGNGRSHATED